MAHFLKLYDDKNDQRSSSILINIDTISKILQSSLNTFQTTIKFIDGSRTQTCYTIDELEGMIYYELTKTN